MTIAGLIQEAHAALPTKEDFARGYKDMAVETASGDNLAIRVTRPPEGVRAELMQRALASGDPDVFVLPTLDAAFASPDFLLTLTPKARMFLAQSAAFICCGPALIDAVAAALRDAAAPGQRH